MTSPAECVGPAALHRGLPRFAEACSVTVGVFDGVHRGHARVIGEAVDRGRRRGLRVRLVTFDPHPAEIVGPRRDVSRLTSLEQRAELAGALGVDDVVVLPFTPVLARLSPAAFVSDVLHGALRAEVVTVGGNFTFGHRGRGDCAALASPGARHGMAVSAVELCGEEGLRHSSTAVREALRRGDVRRAATLLGRPHAVAGVVLPSGRFAVAEELAVPARGSYLVATDDGRTVAASIDGAGRLLVVDVPPGPVTLTFLDRSTAPSSSRPGAAAWTAARKT